MSEPLNLPPTEPGEIVTETTLVPTTLGELGVLPHTRQAFRFHPPTVGTMRKLGALDADAKLRKVPGRYLAYFLGGALAELGGKDCGPAGVAEAGAALVLALPTGDVFALMLAWKRHQSPKGADLGSGECGRCGAAFGSMVLDLNDIQVLALPEGAEPPAARVGLRHGFPWPKEAVVRTVLVQPPTWGETFGHLPEAAWRNPAQLAVAAIGAGIRAVDTTKAPKVPAEALDELYQEDAELISEALERITPTPSLVMEVDCPSCGQVNEHRINWRDAGFFGGSPKA